MAHDASSNSASTTPALGFFEGARARLPKRASDEPYLALELLQGDNLEDRVRRRGPLPVAVVVEIVTQLCEALTAPHAVGVVHRDLKPENVFVVSGKVTNVRLLDFGVARPIGSRATVSRREHRTT